MNKLRKERKTTKNMERDSNRRNLNWEQAKRATKDRKKGKNIMAIYYERHVILGYSRYRVCCGLW